MDKYIDYAVLSDWKAVAGYPDVYYQEVDAIPDDGTDVVMSVIGYNGEKDKVLVKTDVKKEDMEALKVSGATQPTLKFTAYAIQSEYLADQNGDGETNEVDAWMLINS